MATKTCQPSRDAGLIEEGYWNCDVPGGCVDCREMARTIEDHDQLATWKEDLEQVDQAAAFQDEAKPTRTARVLSKIEDIGRVRAYLPANYEAVWVGKEIHIVGTDHAGWSLHDYVIPRLASGLIVAEEIFITETGNVSHLKAKKEASDG